VWIADCVFDGVGRYAINLLQGIQYVWIVHNYLTNCTREIVVSSPSSAINDSIVIYGNECIHTGSDKLSVQLIGDATNLLTNATFSQNVILGGFVEMSALSRFTCVGNVATTGSFASSAAGWRFFGKAQDLTFSGNTLDRSAGASAGVNVSMEG